MKVRIYDPTQNYLGIRPEMKAAPKMPQRLRHRLHQFRTHLGSLQFLSRNYPAGLRHRNNFNFTLNKSKEKFSIHNTPQVYHARESPIRRVTIPMKLEHNSLRTLASEPIQKTALRNRNIKKMTPQRPPIYAIYTTLYLKAGHPNPAQQPPVRLIYPPNTRAQDSQTVKKPCKGT